MYVESLSRKPSVVVSNFGRKVTHRRWLREESTPYIFGKKTNDKNTCSEGRKERPFVPPFLLTFEVFNSNLHNCLVDSRASSNVMPLAICNKLGVVSLKSDKHVIQLDIT
jgi:hypothetical protein